MEDWTNWHHRSGNLTKFPCNPIYSRYSMQVMAMIGSHTAMKFIKKSQNLSFKKSTNPKPKRFNRLLEQLHTCTREFLCPQCLSNPNLETTASDVPCECTTLLLIPAHGGTAESLTSFASRARSPRYPTLMSSPVHSDTAVTWCCVHHNLLLFRGEGAIKFFDSWCIVTSYGGEQFHTHAHAIQSG